jgi:hypothetical protein
MGQSHGGSGYAHLGFRPSQVTCQSGFHHSIMAEVQPDDYVSLCPADAGLFGYAVRSAEPVSDMFHTAVIRVNDPTRRL